MKTNIIYNKDCIDGMKKLPNKSIDMILCDPPYGTTACKWDSIISFESMWKQINRIIKPNGAIVMTATQPFTTMLINSNIKMFKYCWVWDKKIPSGMIFAKYQPMRQTEDIIVFCKGRTVYNPQMILRDKPIKGGGMSKGETTNNQKLKPFKKIYTHKNPTNIIVFDKVRKDSVHPTQKPVSLMEYLIKTYTNEGEIVLDFAIGSGTTAIACINTNRQFIGFELSEKYYNIAKKRVEHDITEKELR